MSEVKKAYQWFTNHTLLGQHCKLGASLSVTFISRGRTVWQCVCYDSSVSWVTCDQKVIPQQVRQWASRLGISRKSRHIELKHLWIQDIFQWRSHLTRESGDSSQPVRCSHEVCSSCSLGQHLPKLNLFKDPGLSQVHKYCSGAEKIKKVKLVKEDVSNHAHADLSKAYQQACSQRQGQICMLDLFRISKKFLPINSEKRQSESGRSFAPPLRRGSETQIQETQAIQVVQIVITYSFRD